MFSGVQKEDSDIIWVSNQYFLIKTSQLICEFYTILLWIPSSSVSILRRKYKSEFFTRFFTLLQKYKGHYNTLETIYITPKIL